MGDRRGYRVPGEVGELEGRGGGTGYRRAWLPEASLSLRDEASLTRLSSPACTLHPAPCDEASLLRLSSPACTLHPAPCDEASLSRLSSSWWSRSTTSCCAAEAVGTLVGTRGLQQQRRTTTYHHSRSKPSTCFPQRAVARRLLGLSSAPLPSLTYGICICICMCICICICICTCVCICMALGSLLSPLAIAHDRCRKHLVALVYTYVLCAHAYAYAYDRCRKHLVALVAPWPPLERRGNGVVDATPDEVPRRRTCMWTCAHMHVSYICICTWCGRCHAWRGPS